MDVPVLYARLCDDAAIFPPGLKPLDRAVPDHLTHRRSGHRDLVGPLVVSAAAVGELPALTRHGIADGDLPLSVVVPSPGRVREVAELVFDVPAAMLVALEVVPDAEASGAATVAELEAQTEGFTVVDVFVEVPRDSRRAGFVEALAGTRFKAKFRTGGVRADLYPDEDELASSIALAVGHGVPFKATAGLHHALRNTDPERGFEQHGFLNLLWATERALEGDQPGVRAALAERDGPTVVAALRDLDDARAARVRAAFTSFGTCSIDEPRDEMMALGAL
ncbi:hypothetical protein [Mariniluteicoccus flavus]